ncbi:MAG: DUF3253 domain-containing protein [Rhodospirillales bacterium]|nr:DUF3253 domain-containing protein [Rhodospirillales bacterium]MDE2319232.1 DUF3253 domain-containing protein [Rhodospirillales bacterium]
MNSNPAEQTILEILATRGKHQSISPTDAAKALAGNLSDESWRRFLAPVKQAAQRLARAGQIEILRKGKPIDPEQLHGVIRLRLTSSEE